ncbi:Bgt-3440 [Blumeria graminis f. sp. tritici]|uniref:Bgt-3440 n=2 Tax=Blumeria graminis f. sp. tritici TaxID=62690 RepID=A0A9X9MPH6_BLUGR|nr:hypothetical protein BGT96224_3440 [Blumeria graminis f. sp. tritici 96224]VDB94864.1 Bgt-3440 [Blumeria graminis f. sp. tritici]
MPRKIIMFAGSPDARSLDWNESGLLNKLQPFMGRLCGVNALLSSEITVSLHPSWRLLSPGPANKEISNPCGHLVLNSLLHVNSQTDSSFSTLLTDSILDILSESSEFEKESIETAERLLCDFYEESYSRTEEGYPSLSTSTPSTKGSISSEDFPSDVVPASPVTSANVDIPMGGHLTDLQEFPNSSYLNSIHPQTMTFNVVVGLISVPETRFVKTRRGTTVELLEVLVGDETQSGFTINFWLPPVSRQINQNQPGENMRCILSKLRARDIILLRNLALGSYCGKVYGHSLKKDITKVYLLYRSRFNHNDIGGCYRTADISSDKTPSTHEPQLQKTRRVWKWVSQFVSVGLLAPSKSREKFQKLDEELLPPDTQ